MLYKYNLIDAFINVFLESFGERKFNFLSSKLSPLVLMVCPAQIQSFDPWC
jgi:hypothetical protein